MDPTEGGVKVAGLEVGRTDAVKDQIGYMAQVRPLWRLTVEENMVFYMICSALARRKRQMAEFLQMTRMAPFRASPPQAQRRHETEAGVDVYAAAQAARVVSG